MAFSPESARARLKYLAYLALISIALAACTTQSSNAVTPKPVLAPTPVMTPMDMSPIASPQTSEMPVVLPSPTSLEYTATSPIETPTSVFPVKILGASPIQWNTGENFSQMDERMTVNIKNNIAANPDQFAYASDRLPQQYLNAVVNLDFSTSDTPWGGTATFIGINRQTNESIFLTNTHVLEKFNEFRIKQPHSGLNVETSLSNSIVANSDSGLFNDISVVKLPFIPDGIEVFPVIRTDLCVSKQPIENMPVYGFGFPYINGGPRHTQYYMEGSVVTLGDDVNGYSNCWYEGASNSLFIPTNISVRVGASGTLALDQNGQPIGLISAISPGGALIKPINPDLLKTLIQQTGFTFEK